MENRTGVLFSGGLVRAGDACTSCGGTNAVGEPGVDFGTAMRTCVRILPLVANSQKNVFCTTTGDHEYESLKVLIEASLVQVGSIVMVLCRPSSGALFRLTPPKWQVKFAPTHMG